MILTSKWLQNPDYKIFYTLVPNFQSIDDCHFAERIIAKEKY